jgi:lysophosphatidate acyltransferase
LWLKTIGIYTDEEFSNLELSRSEVRRHAYLDLIDNIDNRREFTVLRPIPTTDLSSADVGTLSTRVRDQMLDTLRDLYAKLDDSEQHQNPSLRQEKLATRDSDSGPTESTTLSPGIGIELVESLETIPDITGSSRSSSLASSLASSHQRTRDTSGAETEEDDGMILVGRPTHNT